MRYFFHVRDGIDLPDAEGTEFGTLAEARAEAVRLAGQVIRDLAAKFWDERMWELLVTDANHLALFSLCFSGAITPAGAAMTSRAELPL